MYVNMDLQKGAILGYKLSCVQKHYHNNIIAFSFSPYDVQQYCQQPCTDNFYV